MYAFKINHTCRPCFEDIPSVSVIIAESFTDAVKKIDEDNLLYGITNIEKVGTVHNLWHTPEGTLVLR